MNSTCPIRPRSVNYTEPGADIVECSEIVDSGTGRREVSIECCVLELVGERRNGGDSDICGHALQTVCVLADSLLVVRGEVVGDVIDGVRRAAKKRLEQIGRVGLDAVRLAPR